MLRTELLYFFSSFQSQTQGTSGPQPLILAELTQADPQQQKQIIGEHLYRAIMQMHPEKAGKITGMSTFHNLFSAILIIIIILTFIGMLLEMDNSELLHMLESPESLNSKVDEAVGVLLEHQRQDEQIGKNDLSSWEGLLLWFMLHVSCQLSGNN